MATIRMSYENPLSGAGYRLVEEGECWRITRSTMTNGRCQLLHLRVHQEGGPLDQETLSAFAAGESRGGRLDTDVTEAFSHIILHDLRFTMQTYAKRLQRAEVMAAHGRAGFRPGSPLLRQQREDEQEGCSMAAAMLAGAWRATGLQPPSEGLPDWLALALGDGAIAAELTPSNEVPPQAASVAMH